MSEMEYKICVRAEIPHLRGAKPDKAYQYFFHILGPADEVDEYNDKVQWFDYRKGSCRPVSWNGKWGCDLIISHSRDYHDVNFYGTVKEIQKAMDDLEYMFGDNVSRDSMILCAYSWYNGGDEPIKFWSDLGEK